MIDPEKLIGLVIDNQYLLKEFRGEGRFGMVFGADVVTDGFVLGEAAVKLLFPRDGCDSDAIGREIAAMNRLQHAHLIAYKSSGEVMDGLLRGAVYISMDLASRSLAADLASGNRLAEWQALELCEHVGSALVYLAKQGAIHCDVKPANILRVGEVWKLGDFGQVTSVTSAVGVTGTLRYMAPEASRKPCPKSDVWSLGVVLQEVVTGEGAFDGQSDIRLLAQLATETPHISVSLPPALKSIVSACLQKDPADRWDAQSLVAGARRALADIRGGAEAAGLKSRPTIQIPTSPSGDMPSIPAQEQQANLATSAPGRYLYPTQQPARNPPGQQPLNANNQIGSGQLDLATLRRHFEVLKRVDIRDADALARLRDLRSKVQLAQYGSSQRNRDKNVLLATLDWLLSMLGPGTQPAEAAATYVELMREIDLEIMRRLS